MSQEVSLRQRAWDNVQFFLCLGILGLLLVYLVCLAMGFEPDGRTHELPLQVRKSDADWSVTAVQIGELRESGIEVYSGLDDGDQVAGKGVVMLKPVIAESLRVKFCH